MESFKFRTFVQKTFPLYRRKETYRVSRESSHLGVSVMNTLSFTSVVILDAHFEKNVSDT